MLARNALVRRPLASLAEGEITHIDRTPIDVDLAQRQWQAYVDALEDGGWTTFEVAPAPGCPDSVFIEDAVVVYGDLAVLARSGAPSRLGEMAGAQEAVAAQGYRITHIQEPGTLDGGDVLKHGGIVWVGQGGRTNAEGIEQLRAHLEPLGAEVIAVPLTKVLHLKSAVTALPDGSVIGYEPLVDDPSVWGDLFLPVPEEAGSHVVLLGDERILMSTSAPRTAEMFRARGLDVVTVDISEFEKMEGCVTCLSVRLRG